MSAKERSVSPKERQESQASLGDLGRPKGSIVSLGSIASNLMLSGRGPGAISQVAPEVRNGAEFDTPPAESKLLISTS